MILARYIALAALAACSTGGGTGAGGGLSGPAGTTSGNLASWSGTSGTTLVDSGIAASSVVQTSRTITAGTGLTGGGALSGNLTFGLSTTDNQALTVGGLLTGSSGLTVATGNLTITQGFAVHTLSGAITACTTQTQGQCPLTSEVNAVTVSANNLDTVTLPAIPSSGSRQIYIVNFDAAHTVQLFPASGAKICKNSATAGCGATDASITLSTYGSGGCTAQCNSIDATSWGCSHN